MAKEDMRRRRRPQSDWRLKSRLKCTRTCETSSRGGQRAWERVQTAQPSLEEAAPRNNNDNNNTAGNRDQIKSAPSSGCQEDSPQPRTQHIKNTSLLLRQREIRGVDSVPTQIQRVPRNGKKHTKKHGICTKNTNTYAHTQAHIQTYRDCNTIRTFR